MNVDATVHYSANIQSPAGPLDITVSNDFLIGVSFSSNSNSNSYSFQSKLLIEVVDQLHAYFKGQLHSFDLPLQPHGTAFQQDVWKKLITIPYGTTISYGNLADMIGGPTYTRAVGTANGNNPIAIIIPCHRVIGANGSLVGYSGGLDKKRWLLAFERMHKYGTMELFGPDF